MSHEGLKLVSRVALIALLIVAAAVVRTAVGPSKKRGLIMGAGALAGLPTGVALSYPIHELFNVDVSVLSASLGIIVGWAVAWTWARQIPREAA